MRFIVKNEGTLDNPQFAIEPDGDWSKIWNLGFINNNQELEELIIQQLSQLDASKLTFNSDSSRFHVYTQQQKIAQSMSVKFKKAVIKGLQRKLLEELTN